jgi:hypothetical protein
LHLRSRFYWCKARRCNAGVMLDQADIALLSAVPGIYGSFIAMP